MSGQSNRVGETHQDDYWAWRNGKTLNDSTNLSNLFVTLLQRMGLDAAGFGGSTGTLAGLEIDGG